MDASFQSVQAGGTDSLDTPSASFEHVAAAAWAEPPGTITPPSLSLTPSEINVAQAFRPATAPAVPAAPGSSELNEESDARKQEIITALAVMIAKKEAAAKELSRIEESIAEAYAPQDAAVHLDAMHKNPRDSMESDRPILRKAAVAHLEHEAAAKRIQELEQELRDLEATPAELVRDARAMMQKQRAELDAAKEEFNATEKSLRLELDLTRQANQELKQRVSAIEEAFRQEKFSQNLAQHVGQHVKELAGIVNELVSSIECVPGPKAELSSTGMGTNSGFDGTVLVCKGRDVGWGGGIPLIISPENDNGSLHVDFNTADPPLSAWRKATQKLADDVLLSGSSDVGEYPRNELQATLEKQQEALKRLERLIMPKDAGMTCAQAKSAGLSLVQVRAAGYSCAEAKEANFFVILADIKQAGYSCLEMKQAGYTCKDCRNAGFLPTACNQAGFTFDEAVSAGFAPTGETFYNNTLSTGVYPEHQWTR